MIETLGRFIQCTGLFKEMGWSDDRTSAAMMHELFSELLKYYQKQINYNHFDPRLSRRIDLLQSIVDTWND